MNEPPFVSINLNSLKSLFNQSEMVVN